MTTPFTGPRKHRLATFFTFVVLVVVGRQFTPRTSSAAEVLGAGVDNDGPSAPGVFFLEQTAAPGPARFRVRDQRGRVVVEGLTASQLAYHFPELDPGPAVGEFSVAGTQER